MVGRALLMASLAYVLLVGLAASEENLKFDDLQKAMEQYMDDDENLQAEVMDHLIMADDEDVSSQFDDEEEVGSQFDDEEEVASQFDDEEVQRKFFTQLKSEMANDQSFSLSSQVDLNRLLRATLPYLRSRLLAVRIPDFSGSTGSLSYTLSNMRITDVRFGTTSLRHNYRDTLQLTAYVSVLNAALHWRYRYKKWFVRIRDSGRLTMNSGGIRMQISVRFSPGPPPSLRSAGCSFSIGRLSVRFHGGASWLYNLFKGTVARRIKSYLNSRVCGFVEPVLTREGTRALQRFAG